jgi:hypothetical protein
MNRFEHMSELEWEAYARQLLQRHPEWTVAQVMQHIVNQARQDGYNQGVNDAMDKIRNLICASTK